MARPNDFSSATKQLALNRQKNRCAVCGERIISLGESGKEEHRFGEAANAHHATPIKSGGTKESDNCVIICRSCHYSIHEGGNYRHGTVEYKAEEFPYYNG